MVAINQIVDQYRLEASTSGVEATAAAAQKLAGATDAVAVSSEKQERRVLSVAKAVENFAAKNDVLFRAQQQVSRAQDLLNRAFEQGLADTLAYQRGVAVLAEREEYLAKVTVQATRAMTDQATAAAQRSPQWAALSAQGVAQEKAFQASERLNAQWRAFAAQGAAQAKAIGTVETAHAGATRQTNLHAGAWQNLSFQANDAITMLASGSGVFQVLATQGGQVYQVLSSARGGVGGALSDIKDRLLVISPLTGVLGLIGIGALAAGAAALRYTSQQNDLRDATLGIGRAAGVSAEQLDRMAEEGAKGANISIASAKEIEQALLRTGKIQGEVFAGAFKPIKDYAAALGQDLPTAAKEVGQSLATLGSGGLEDLQNRTYAFRGETVRLIKDLLATGDTAKAQRVALDELGRGLDDAARRAERYGGVFSSLRNTISDFWTWAGKTTVTGNAMDPAGRADQLQQRVTTRKAAGYDTTEDERRLKILRDAMDETSRKADETGRKARQNAEATATAAVKATIPQIESLEQINSLRSEANKVVNARENSGDTNSQEYRNAKIALEALTKAQADYNFAGGASRVEGYKREQQIKAEQAALEAKTPADRANAASMKATADMIGAVIPRAERYAQMNEASNKVLRDQAAASKEASRVQNEATDTQNQLADASAKSAASVARLAAERRVDAQIAAGTISAGERELKVREDLSGQISILNKETAERVRSARDQAAVQVDLNSKVAAGTMVSAEAQQRMASELEISRLVREADAAQGAEKVALTQRINDLRAATEAQMSAEDRARVLGLAEDEGRRIKVLERERELLGETVEVRSRELALLQARQGLERQGIRTSGPEEQSYLNKVALRSDFETAKAQSERLAQDLSQVFSGIFDDMFKAGNKGMAGFLDGFSKGFARIASRMIEQNLLAPLFGGQGGVAGGANGFDLKKLLDFSGIEKAVSSGSEKGIFSSFENLLKPQAGKDGKATGGFASSPLGGGLLAAGAGAAIGYQSQSPLMGALGGGLSGYAIGGPIGGIIGAGAGLLGGLLGESAAKKAAKKQAAAELKAAKDAYEEAKPQIDALRRTFTGEGNGSVTGQVDAAFTQYRQANFSASKAGDQATADKLTKEFEGYFQRLYVVFQRSFSGTLGELQAGLGTNGPFAQAAAAVSELGESLKGFIVDTKAIVGADLLEPARRAAQESALASLEPAKALSATLTELSRIRGTAAGLTQVLIDLGLSADAAAVAIQDRTAKAMDALRASFSADLGAKTNDALGKGYLNEVAALVKERQGLLADAAAIGVDAAQVEAYFTAAAQKIVDCAELTGDAFGALVTQFPALNGGVHAFSEALDTAAAKSAAAARALTFQDRLFSAVNDTSTLDGQLAAYDRQAQREREDEVKAGGQAMAGLEAAQYAERLKIVQTYNDQATAATRQTLDQARTAFASFSGSIRDYLDGLNAGSNSTLSPAERLKAAQGTYGDRLASAQGGNRDALDGITGNATNLLDAAKAYYGSGSGYQDVLASVKSSLALLPKQVSAEQFIVNAIEAMQSELTKAVRENSPALISQALTKNFGALDTTLDGLLGVDEFMAGLDPLATKAEQDAAREIFRSIDANGDGQISRLELLGYTIEQQFGRTPGKIAAALRDDFNALDTSVNGLLDFDEFARGLGPLATKAEQDAAKELFRSIDANGDGQIDKLELLAMEIRSGVATNSPGALAASLAGSFDKLDTSMNGLLDVNELVASLGPLATRNEQEAARAIFKQIDLNGDGQISRMELLTRTIQEQFGASPGQIARALSDNFGRLDTSVNGLLDYGEFLAGLGPLATKAEQDAARALFQSIDLNGDGQISQLELVQAELRSGFTANRPGEIAAALSRNFALLDTSVNGLLDFDEFARGLGPLATKAEQDAAAEIFRAIDLNGDGQIDKLELLRVQLLRGLNDNSPGSIATALAENFRALDTSVNGLLDYGEFSVGLGPLATKAEQDRARAIFDSIDSNGDGMLSALELMRSSLREAIEKNDGAGIVNALAANFATLDTSVNGLLSLDELLAGLGPLATKAEQDTAKRVFEAIDRNGDGQISQLELVSARAAGILKQTTETKDSTDYNGALLTWARDDLNAGLTANSPSQIARALEAHFALLDTSVNGLLDFGEFSAGLGPLATKAEQDRARAIFDAIDANGDGQLDKLELVRARAENIQHYAWETSERLNWNNTLFNASIDLQRSHIDRMIADFNRLDTSVNGLLDYGEFSAGLGPLATKGEQEAARVLFNAIDANGDGQIDKLELVRARTEMVEREAAATKDAVGSGNAIQDQQKQLLDALQRIQEAAKNTLGDSKGLLQAISELSGLQRDQLSSLNRQFTLDSNITINGYTLSNNMVTALNKIVFNTAGAYSKLNGGRDPVAYASGGWVTGPGTGTSDSVRAMLSNGEFVVQAAAARAYGPILEAMNENSFTMPAVGLPMPVMTGGEGSDFGEMVAELRALRTEVASLRGDVREGNDVAEQGHLATIGAVKRTTVAIQEGNAADSRQALARNPKAA